MKTKKLLYIGMALLGLSSCSDYLDVEAPSAFTDTDVMQNTTEANRLLNSVYQQICQDATYGSNYFTTFCLNSDVEFFTSTAEEKGSNHEEWRLFDGDADGNNVSTMWRSAYSTVEAANNFIHAAENSEMYAQGDTALIQMIGEAKCLRAMQYLDLVIMFGDVPFSLTRAYDSDGLVMPLAEGGRDEILSTLIDDLRGIAPQMKFAKNMTDGVERCSKEFAWSLIAKIALFRGGYSLRPGASPSDKGTMQLPSDYLDYYQIARTYCDSVIQSGTHALTKDWYQVFIDECNFKVAVGDDPIFEIPFSQDVSGRVGNVHGPAVTASNAGGTDIPWGVSAGSVRLNAFHRFTYDENDVRRAAIGYWSYTYDGIPTILGATAFNNYTNKWSKLWDENHVTGPQSSTNTGINFPYMRYADVLLMFAEAENEINNGPTPAARAALKQVRERAFRGAANSTDMVEAYVDNAISKEDFFNLIVDERAWEFAGESSRWKDLVRWNLYAEKIYLAFWKYYGFGSDDYSYDLNDEYDLINKRIFYKQVANDGSYPNKTLDVLTFYVEHNEDDGKDYNTLWTPLPRHKVIDPETGEEYETRFEPSTTGSDAWQTVDGNWYKWIDDNTGIARAECRCSLRGYIYINQQGRLISEAPEYNDAVNLKALPAVRYILPFPQDAINRSNGLYKNYYGY